MREPSLTNESIVARNTRENYPQWSLVLIDDCPDYCLLMKATAAEIGVNLTAYTSLEEMYTIARLRQYDLALIDYNLDKWCGLEIAHYIDIFFADLPVLIVSGDTIEWDDNWPESIQGIVNKDIGPKCVIRYAMDLLCRIKFLKAIDRGVV